MVVRALLRWMDIFSAAQTAGAKCSLEQEYVVDEKFRLQYGR
jgi:hypothetical protein